MRLGTWRAQGENSATLWIQGRTLAGPADQTEAPLDLHPSSWRTSSKQTSRMRASSPQWGQAHLCCLLKVQTLQLHPPQWFWLRRPEIGQGICFWWPFGTYTRRPHFEKPIFKSEPSWQNASRSVNTWRTKLNFPSWLLTHFFIERSSRLLIFWILLSQEKNLQAGSPHPNLPFWGQWT